VQRDDVPQRPKQAADAVDRKRRHARLPCVHQEVQQEVAILNNAI
jgi:hypothetical protein